MAPRRAEAIADHKRADPEGHEQHEEHHRLCSQAPPQEIQPAQTHWSSTGNQPQGRARAQRYLLEGGHGRVDTPTRPPSRHAKPWLPAGWGEAGWLKPISSVQRLY